MGKGIISCHEFGDAPWLLEITRGTQNSEKKQQFFSHETILGAQALS